MSAGQDERVGQQMHQQPSLTLIQPERLTPAHRLRPMHQKHDTLKIYLNICASNCLPVLEFIAKHKPGESYIMTRDDTGTVNIKETRSYFYRSLEQETKMKPQLWGFTQVKQSMALSKMEKEDKYL